MAELPNQVEITVSISSKCAMCEKGPCEFGDEDECRNAVPEPSAVTLPLDVANIILSDPQMWSDTIRTIARQRARLDRQLAGRRKPIEPDDVDCGVPHLVEG